MSGTAPINIMPALSNQPQEPLRTFGGPGGINLLADESDSPDKNTMLWEYTLPYETADTRDPPPPPAHYPSPPSLSFPLPARNSRTGTIYPIPSSSSPLSHTYMVASPYHHHRSHSLSKKDLLLFTTNARGGGGATSSGVVGMERAATISTSVPIPHSAHLGLFACPYEPCTHTFPHLLEMRAHCFQEHSQATPHSCQTCLQTFTRRNDLLRHQKTVHHQGLTMNVCQVCKKEFARMDSLRRHERICM